MLRSEGSLASGMDWEAPSASSGRKESSANSKLWSPSRHLLWWALGAFLVGLIFLIAFAAMYEQCKRSAPSSPPGKDEDESSICFLAYFSTLGTFMIIAFVATFFLLALAAGKRGTPCEGCCCKTCTCCAHPDCLDSCPCCACCYRTA